MHSPTIDTEVRVLLESMCARTSLALTSALRRFDSQAEATVVASLDVGFPHDAIRLGAGFPTGCLVRWSCNEPAVPIDTTVNVCTSSVYALADDMAPSVTPELFSALLSELERSSYVPNFHRGNHFISFSRMRSTNQPILVLHSSAAEFKKQFNGLYPVTGNWFSKAIKREETPWATRLLIGRTAEAFFRLASSLPAYNATRHDFVAETLLADSVRIDSVSHLHHYYMPDSQSVVIGSFLAAEGEVVPIFTYPGDPLIFFKVGSESTCEATVEGKRRLLIPHGWGKTSARTPRLSFDAEGRAFVLNDERVLATIDSSLRDHPDLVLRRYAFVGDRCPTYEQELAAFCRGQIIDLADQVASFSKIGFKRWPF